MKKLIFSVIFLSFAIMQLHSQNNGSVNFEYDNSGNCIVKYKTIVMYSASAPTDENEIITDSAAILNDAAGSTQVQIEDSVGEVNIVIYPNPTDGILNIMIQNSDGQTPVNYVLMQSSGKYLFGGATSDNPFALNLSGFSNGVYLLRLTINGNTRTYKIIKK